MQRIVREAALMPVFAQGFRCSGAKLFSRD
jgi:hypothetical protein